MGVEAPEGYASTTGPLVFLNAESPATTLNFDLEPLPDTSTAVQGPGFPIWALLVLIGGGAVAAGFIINEVTEDDTP